MSDTINLLMQINDESTDETRGLDPGEEAVDADGRKIAGLLRDVVAPTASDDGFPVGTLWIDTVTDRVYVCVDNTAAAAIWSLQVLAGVGAGVANRVAVWTDADTLGSNSTLTFNGTRLTVSTGTPATTDSNGAVVISAGGGLSVSGAGHFGSTTAAGSGQYAGSLSTQGGIRIGAGLGPADTGVYASEDASSFLGFSYATRIWALFHAHDDIEDGNTSVALMGMWTTTRPGANNGDAIGVWGITAGNDGAEQGANYYGVRGSALYGTANDNREGTNFVGVHGVSDMRNVDIRNNTAKVRGGWFQAWGQSTTNAASDRNVYGVQAAANFVTSGSFDWNNAYGGHFVATALTGVDNAYGIYAAASGADTVNLAALLDGDTEITGTLTVGDTVGTAVVVLGLASDDQIVATSIDPGLIPAAGTVEDSMLTWDDGAGVWAEDTSILYSDGGLTLNGSKLHVGSNIVDGGSSNLTVLGQDITIVNATWDDGIIVGRGITGFGGTGNPNPGIVFGGDLAGTTMSNSVIVAWGTSLASVTGSLDNAIIIANGGSFSSNIDDSIIIGRPDAANSTNMVIIGRTSRGTGIGAVALGHGADALGADAVAIGRNASAASGLITLGAVGNHTATVVPMTQAATSPTVGALRVAGGVGVGGAGHFGSAAVAGSGQYAGALSAQGGLRLGFGLTADSSDAALFVTQGSLNDTNRRPAIYTSWFYMRHDDESAEAAAIVGKVGTDSGFAQGAAIGVVGIARFDSFNENWHPLIGGRFIADCRDRPADHDVVGIQVDVDARDFRANATAVTDHYVIGVDIDVAVTGDSNAIDETRNVYGIRSVVRTTAAGTHNLSVGYGGYFDIDLTGNTVPTVYGVYARAAGGTTNWAAYLDGRVHVGDLTTTVDAYLLDIEGGAGDDELLQMRRANALGGGFQFDANNGDAGMHVTDSTYSRAAGGHFVVDISDAERIYIGAGTINKSTSAIKISSSQRVTIQSSEASTSVTNGALVVAGGAGIGERLNVGGNADILGDLAVGDDLDFADELRFGSSDTQRSLVMRVNTAISVFSNGTNNANGWDTFCRTQSAGPNTGGNPRGGDIIWDFGAGTGTGRTGRMDINGVAEIDTVLLPAVSALTENGAVWRDSTQKAIRTYVNNVEQSLVGCIFTQTANQTIANSTTETVLLGTGVGTKTLPADFFVVGKTVRVVAYGTIANTGTPTIRVRIRLDTTVVVDTGALSINSLGGTRPFRVECLLTCRTTGATGTVEGAIWFSYTNAAGATNARVLTVSPVGATVDTTSSKDVNLSFQWGTASASNTITSRQGTIEVLN